MDTFQVHILAADRTLYEGPCVSLTIPASDGERGILAHHAGMMAAIVPGTLRYQPPEQEARTAAISLGMVKVEKTRCWCWPTLWSARRRSTRPAPAGRPTRPGKLCCKSAAVRSIRWLRPPWPGR